MKHLLTFILAICLFNYTQATTRKVPQQYSTIQAALNACAANDTVWVKKGTYFENIVWPATKGIKLLSKSGSGKTFIDAQHNGRVMHIVMNDTLLIDSTTVIDGFTIRNGYFAVTGGPGEYQAAGMIIYQASPKIENCVITENRIKGVGAGVNGFGGAAGIMVYGSNSNLILRHVTISRNRIDSVYNSEGAALYTGYGSTITLSDCTISEDTMIISGYAFGGIISSNENMKLTNCVIQKNYVSQPGLPNVPSSILRVEGGSSSFINCLITDNTGINDNASRYVISSNYQSMFLNSTIARNHLSGAGTHSSNSLFYGGFNVGEDLIVTNCIFWNPDNDLFYDDIFASLCCGGSSTVSYSDIGTHYPGTGNIKKNPMFESKKNYHLKATSPCVNTGSNVGTPPTDLDGNPRPLPAGTNVDMGCYELGQPLRSQNPDQEINLVMTVFPNPVSSSAVITFMLDQPSHVLLKLFSVDGKEVRTIAEENFSEGHHQITFNRESLGKGIYFLKITSDQGVMTEKIVCE